VDPEVLAGSFGQVADAYERGRPRYPEAALDHLTSELGLDGSSTVVDLAAGTGKLTRDLVPRYDRVIAVEPLDEMRARLGESAPGAEARAGTAEEIPLPQAVADAVFVAQAFHWFDPDKAPPEIARVLRPGGALVPIWNTREEREGWIGQIRDIINRYKGDTPQHEDDDWRIGVEQSGLFEPIQQRNFEQVQEVSRSGAIEVFASRSYVSALPDDQRRRALEEIAAVVPDEEAITIPYVTEVYWTRRSA
jgi:SAM-dependent methyltransferase